MNAQQTRLASAHVLSAITPTNLHWSPQVICKRYLRVLAALGLKQVMLPMPSCKKCDMCAYLATITSSEEDVFVHELGREFHSYYGIRRFFVGGVQNVNSPAFMEPGGSWEWVNDKGTIPIKMHPNTELYSNWAPK
jgi:hypothetical protein